MISSEQKSKAVDFITANLGRLNVEHQLVKLGDVINNLKEKDFPVDVASDLVYLKIDLLNEPEFIIYSLLRAIDKEVYNDELHVIEKYGFNSVVSLYEEQKYQVKKFSFPLKFKMVQINDSMWIGAISAKDLMELRDEQIIYYNENTQRKLRHVVDTRSNIEYYTIDIKQSSIDSIQDLMMKGLYIPDALTFNMPEDSDWTYDAKNCQLVIKSLDHFDIIDGYHRYRAISNLCQTNKDFDYIMQLQIVAYSESKAQQFMWQKDQQTKLKKLDSITLNQENAGTRIAQKLNENPDCCLYGKINRNSKIINSIELANVIQCIFFNNTKKKQDFATLRQVETAICEEINEAYYADKHYILYSASFSMIINIVLHAYTEMTCQKQNFIRINQISDFAYLDKTRVMKKIDATRIAKAMGVSLDV